MSSEDRDDQLPPFDTESVKEVLDLVRREYADQNDRAKTLDTKTTVFMGATATAMFFIPARVEDLGKTPSPWTPLLQAGFLLAFVLLVCAQVSFFLSMWVRTFGTPDASEWVHEDKFREQAHVVRARIAATLEFIIHQNHSVHEKKALWTKVGQLLFFTSIILVGISVIARASLL